MAKKKLEKSNFYGSTIVKGKLHKVMKVPQGKNLDVNKLNKQLRDLKKIKNKSASQLRKEREIVFAINSRKFKKK